MKEKLQKLRDLVDELMASLDAQEAGPHASDFERLRSLLDSDAWPPAVFEEQLVDEGSESDKMDRAEAICDIMLPPLSGVRFLDFGCGEGHVARYASFKAALSVGYDPAASSHWDQGGDRLVLTSDLEKVASEGPYDIVLVYDVVDHASEEPSEVLRKAGSVLADDGRIHLRCHPWSGRHGGHLYRKLNKAFAHLVFGEEELKGMGMGPTDNRKIHFPLSAYDRAITEAGLEAVSDLEVDRQDVEPFFRSNPLVSSRILASFGLDEWTDDKPGYQMSQCFVDYVLKKK